MLKIKNEDIKTAIEGLGDNEYFIFSKSLRDIYLYFQENGESGDSTLLYECFNFEEELEDDDLNAFPILDKAFEQHQDELTSDDFIHFAFITLQDIKLDSFEVTIKVVEALIKKKDVEAQKRFVQIFYDSMEYYDAGHRYFSSNVQDLLIDSYFEDFEPEALLLLLDMDNYDLLNHDIGDGLDVLYIPLFREASSQHLNQAKKQFLTYMRGYLKYSDKAYFRKLIQGIQVVNPKDAKELLVVLEES